MKNSNGPDKPREDLLTRMRQEMLPDTGGLGGELRNYNGGMWMKCCIVRDLLPGYIDGLTCEETNEEIRVHLESCAECRIVYEQMTAVIPVEASKKLKEIDFFKKFRARIHQRYVVVGCMICLALIGLTLFAKSYQIPIPYDAERMVTETYQAVPVLNQYGLTQWQDLQAQDLETIQAVLNGTCESIDLIRMTITESVGNDNALSIGRTVEQNGTDVRIVYYCYTKTLWNSLFEGEYAFADSFTTTGDLYGGRRLDYKTYEPMMTEIYYLPRGDLERLGSLSDEAFVQLKEEAQLVWSGMN